MDNDILNSSFKKSESVVFRRIAGQNILVPVKKDAVDLEALFSLNETAARIWELIDGKRTVKGISNIIASEFANDSEETEKDTVSLFRQLYDLRFILAVTQ